MCLAEIRDVKSKAVVAFWHRGSRKNFDTVQEIIVF